MTEDLTKSSSVTVRWQAQMEEHLTFVREHSKIGGRTEAATANALAAIALAIANTVGDLELPLTKIASAIEELSP